MAGSGLRRLELPSGGWWVVDSRISHRVARDLCALSQEDSARRLGRVLFSMTVEWGFDDSPSEASVMRRDIRDIEAVTSVLLDDALPALRRLISGTEAEEVFKSLISGKLPSGYGDVALMESTGWTWQELQDTPEDVVRRMRVYLSVKSVVERGWEPQS